MKRGDDVKVFRVMSPTLIESKFHRIQPHLRGIHGQLSDILAESAAADATAALEEEIRTLRGRLAASEELLRLRRRAGHFDARTEALTADIARASTPGPVNVIQERASAVNLGQNSRADDGQAGRDSRAEARPSLEVSRADFESQSERGEEEQITEGPLEAIPVHDLPALEPLPEATASESSWVTGLRSQHSTVNVAHLQAENARLQEQMCQQMALMQQVLNTLQLSRLSETRLQASEKLHAEPLKSLPQLPEPKQQKDRPLVLRKWLEQVRLCVEPLSEGATSYWSGVLDAAVQTHEQFVLATPIERVGLVPEFTVPEACLALEKRLRPLLLASLPQSIKEDCVTAGRLAVVDLLFAVHVVFSPGGSEDKAAVLHFIHAPPPARTATEAEATLRRWQANVKRASELGLVQPDPSVCYRALRLIVQHVEASCEDFKFRSQTFRVSSGLDHHATQEKVSAYAVYLQGEARTLSLAEDQDKSSNSNAGKQQHHPGNSHAAAQQMDELAARSAGVHNPRQDGNRQPAAARHCKFFSKASGCRKGGACSWQHAWLDPSSGRCFHCGSSAHKASACDRPTRSDGGPHKPLPAGKAKAAPKPSPKALPAPQKGISDASLADLVAKQVRTTMLELVSEARQRPASSGSAPSAQPELRGARLAPVVLPDTPGVLVDSGASHVVRPAAPEEDWRLLREVAVKVALGPDQTAFLDEHEELVSPQAGDTAMSLGRYIHALDLAFYWDRDVATLTDKHTGEVFSLSQQNFSPFLSKPDFERLRQSVHSSVQSSRPDPNCARLFLDSLSVLDSTQSFCIADDDESEVTFDPDDPWFSWLAAGHAQEEEEEMPVFG